MRLRHRCHESSQRMLHFLGGVLAAFCPWPGGPRRPRPQSAPSCLGYPGRRRADRRLLEPRPAHRRLRAARARRRRRAAQRTEARVAYDDEAIYVAVRAFDSDPAAIKAFLTRRDVWSASDWIRVYIDCYHDRRTAYSFAVNPVGVKLDSLSLQRQQPGRQLGRGVGRGGGTRRRRAGARSSGSRCRSSASAPAATAAWDSRWRATWRA